MVFPTQPKNKFRCLGEDLGVLQFCFFSHVLRLLLERDYEWLCMYSFLLLPVCQQTFERGCQNQPRFDSKRRNDIRIRKPKWNSRTCTNAGMSILSMGAVGEQRSQGRFLFPCPSPVSPYILPTVLHSFRSLPSPEVDPVVQSFLPPPS